MNKNKTGNSLRVPTEARICLDESLGSSNNLGPVRTGKRGDMIRELKGSLHNWMKNSHFESFRKEKLDIAITAILNKKRMKTQDVDNISKVVLDALKKNDRYSLSDYDYLFEDDSQIVRLLVQKIEVEEDEQYDTESVHVEFRKHDPKKEMVMVRKYTIG